MNWDIFEPTDDLRDFVKCYWTLESPKEKTPKKNNIVPDGTMKMIFHYGDLYQHYPSTGEVYPLNRCLLVGQLTRPYVVAPTGETGTFFVRFHPNGFLPFATFPIKEIENATIPLEEVFGAEGAELGKKILGAKNTAERISIAEAFLLSRLTDAKTVDRIVQSTVETIFTGNGQIPVLELSRKNKVNRRQLSRKFSSSIGLSPKQLSKTIRLQKTLQALLHKKPEKLTDTAYENEYYDQSHFIKDFKEFTGLTPREFYGDQLKMSLIFDGKE